MIAFFLLPENVPFSTALALMILMTILEIISATLGMGLSEMVDSVIPEIDADIDVDIDADIDGVDAGAGSNSLIKLLAWFRVGEVPVIILFIILLTGFGIIGMLLQFTIVQFFGSPLPAFAAAVPAFLGALPIVRSLGGILGKYMPKDETYVVSEKSFIGQVATVTMGTARQGNPAEAKLKDQHGQTHYLLVLPDKDDETFVTGEKCIVVSQNGSIYRVIKNMSTVLTD